MINDNFEMIILLISGPIPKKRKKLMKYFKFVDVTDKKKWTYALKITRIPSFILCNMGVLFLHLGVVFSLRSTKEGKVMVRR